MTYTDHSHNLTGSYFAGNHTHTFNPSYTTASSATIGALIDRYYNEATKQKEPEVTTLEKVKRERQEAIERKRIEAMYSDYDELGLDLVEDGAVFRFEWERKDKTYTYAALKADGRWYVTGGSAPNGLPTEDFVAWLIGKEIPAVGLTLLEVAP